MIDPWLIICCTPIFVIGGYAVIKLLKLLFEDKSTNKEATK